MEQYVGLDVSLKETHYCVVDADGVELARGREVTRASLQKNARTFDPQLSELPPGKEPSGTFIADREAFLNPGGRNQRFGIAPPDGLSATAFRELVIQYGDSYRAKGYGNRFGPNSNSAAAFPLFEAGAPVPNVPMTPFLYYYSPDQVEFRERKKIR